jgi:hypothetical protein
MPRTKKTEKPANSSKLQKSKSEEPYIVIPITIPIVKLDKKIKEGKATYKELLMTAEECAIDAYVLWSKNKHEEGLSFAIAAMVLYDELKDINYPFSESDHDLIRMAQGVIDKHKLSKNIKNKNTKKKRNKEPLSKYPFLIFFI